MGSTYHALFAHAFFHTKYNRPQIDPAWEEDLYRIIALKTTEAGGHLVAIGGIETHVHTLFSFTPTLCIADLMRRIKSYSSLWVHELLGLPEFAWQEGYTAIGVSPSIVPATVGYIRNQKEHHKRVTPRSELITTLDACEIEYDPRYLPDL